MNIETDRQTNPNDYIPALYQWAEKVYSLYTGFCHYSVLKKRWLVLCFDGRRYLRCKERAQRVGVWDTVYIDAQFVVNHQIEMNALVFTTVVFS